MSSVRSTSSIVAPSVISSMPCGGVFGFNLNEHHDVAAVGPLVVGADGEVEQSARRFPTMRTGLFGRTSLAARVLPEAARDQLLARPEQGPTDVDWVSGACLVIDGGALAHVGPLDEGYFMYWEDADWCRRAAGLGLRIQYRPELVVHHAQGSSSSARPFMTTIAFHRSAFRYYARHVARSRSGRAVAAIGQVRGDARLGGRVGQGPG